MARGRKSILDDELKEKIRDLFESGKTVKQVAEIIGVTNRTIYYWMRNNTEMLHLIKEAKQVADELVEASLFRRATGYSHPEEKVFCNKDGIITTHETTKHYPPDTVAAFIWLKNRAPDRWSDNPSGEGENEEYETPESLVET